jgi:hypothetical protein
MLHNITPWMFTPALALKLFVMTELSYAIDHPSKLTCRRVLEYGNQRGAPSG